MTKDQALELLHANMQNQNLRRHCYAVGKALAAFHDYYQANGISGDFAGLGDLTSEEWEITGILHDADWELTAKDESQHTLMLLKWLEEHDAPEEMKDVFRSHNNKTTGLREPQTLLEWTLECVDELTGFIVAVALILPSKKLADVAIESIIKKFGQKDFAKAVHREQITQCEEKLGIPVSEFVRITLTSMQTNSELLGL